MIVPYCPPFHKAVQSAFCAALMRKKEVPVAPCGTFDLVPGDVK
jgi:hypothetical protein